MAFVPDVEVQQVIAYLTQSAKDFEKAQAIKAGMIDATKIFIARGKLNLHARLLGYGKGGLLRSMTNEFVKRTTTAYAGFKHSDYEVIRPHQFGNHAHLVDLGTVERFTKKGVSRGIMPANLFWHDARISEQGRAVDAIVDGVQREIDRMQSRFENE